MAIQDQSKNSKLGLKGRAPAFGISPKNSLHDTYSTNGRPNVRWISQNPTNPIPQPTILDQKLSKDKYNSTNTYLNNI